jgi:hypothetical protein
MFSNTENGKKAEKIDESFPLFFLEYFFVYSFSQPQKNLRTVTPHFAFQKIQKNL